MQDDCTPEKIAQTLLALIESPDKAREQLTHFHEQHARLRGSGSAGAAAAVGEVAGA
jgi:lipid A disaccharide synthetase